MNTKATIIAIKSLNQQSYDFDFCFKDEDGKIRSIRDIENILRDGAGLSAKEAKKFLAEGYGALDQRDADENDELLSSLKTLAKSISA